MYIREQANLIQLIRTTYDPVIKRGRQVVFARFKDSTTAPMDVRALCTTTELAQLDDYLAAKLTAVTAENHHHRLAISPIFLDTLTDSIASLSAEMEAEILANKLWNASLKLQKALKAAGFPRPARPEKIRVVDKSQTELSV